MGTQKTNIGGRPKDAVEQTQPGENINVSGRGMQRVDMRNTLHQAMDSMQQASMVQPGHNMMNPGPGPVPPEAKEELNRAVPEFLRKQEERHEEYTPRTEQVDGLTPEQADLAGKLSQKIVEAKRDGREEAAKELESLLGQLIGQLEPKRIRKPKKAHPALQKLRQSLGLKRIQPVSVEWCGIKWHLHAPPPALDRWVAEMTENGLGTYAALKLAASIVGLDGAPLYEVFGVDTKAEYEPPDGSDPIEVRLYEKRCEACGDVIDVDATSCIACGSTHDPFNMPIELRVRCAELMNRHFAEEFGPYEDLHRLLELVRERMPDRVSNKEKLYPFPELLPTSSSETNTTLPGEKQSSD